MSQQLAVKYIQSFSPNPEFTPTFHFVYYPFYSDSLVTLPFYQLSFNEVYNRYATSTPMEEMWHFINP
jgi:hypothetical protein